MLKLLDFSSFKFWTRWIISSTRHWHRVAWFNYILIENMLIWPYKTLIPPYSNRGV